MAPGSQIASTLPLGGYGAWSGTSMATPMVVGIAALARTYWPDKAIYSSWFIMGQIASTAPWLGSYRSADALAALIEVPELKLSYLEHWLFDTTDIDPDNDNDGIVDAGETVDLAIVIRNHWGVQAREIVYLFLEQFWAVLLPIFQGLNGREVP